MTPRELLSDLPLGPGDQRANLLYARLLLIYLADHVYDLRDASDFRVWLLDLAAELRQGMGTGQFPSSTEVQPPTEIRPRSKVMPQSRWDDVCPRCGHVHEGSGECGVRMGKDIICRCELEVSA